MDIPARIIKDGGFTIRLMQPDDAPRVVELYRRVYGEHYPIPAMYDPDYIVKQQERGLMYRVIILDGSGQLVAHQALYRTEDTYDGIYESGHGIILPEYRGRGLNNDIMQYIWQVLLPAVGVEIYWGEAVANHIFMQKSVASLKGVETGLELDLMPAASYEKEASATGRVSTVVTVFPPQVDKPHTVFLPLVYEDILGHIYGLFDVERQMASSAALIPVNGPTRLSHFYFPPAQVLRITVYEAGADLNRQMEDLEQTYLQQGARIMQVYVPLGKAWAGDLTALLNRRGYFFGALLLRWFDQDGLLLQKIMHEPHWEGIVLYTDRSRELLEFIRADRRRVLSGQG